MIKRHFRIQISGQLGDQPFEAMVTSNRYGRKTIEEIRKLSDVLMDVLSTSDATDELVDTAVKCQICQDWMMDCDVDNVNDVAICEECMESRIMVIPACGHCGIKLMCEIPGDAHSFYCGNPNCNHGDSTEEDNHARKK